MTIAHVDGPDGGGMSETSRLEKLEKDAASRRLMFWAMMVVVVLVVTVLVVQHVRRAREWTHGGDDVTVSAQAVLATGSTFDAVAVRLGTPAGAIRDMTAKQTLVTRVDWSGLPDSAGMLGVIALDKRSNPPQRMAAEGGWSTTRGFDGSGWGSAYPPLADHYDWLSDARTERTYTSAVSAPAAASGSLVAWFHPAEFALPLTDPAQDVVLALVYTDGNGEVRWARRIYG